MEGEKSFIFFNQEPLPKVRDPMQAQALNESEEAPPLNKLGFEGKRVIEVNGVIKRFEMLERKFPYLKRFSRKFRRKQLSSISATIAKPARFSLAVASCRELLENRFTLNSSPRIKV